MKFEFTSFKKSAPLLAGDYIQQGVFAYSSELIAPFLKMDMSCGFALTAGDTIDVVRPGTCLIETENGSRHIVRMIRGEMTGPLRILEVADIEPFVLQQDIEDLKIYHLFSLANIFISMVFFVTAMNGLRLSFAQPVSGYDFPLFLAVLSVAGMANALSTLGYGAGPKAAAFDVLMRFKSAVQGVRNLRLIGQGF